jgi:hypothetical protein
MLRYVLLAAEGQHVALVEARRTDGRVFSKSR